MGRCELILRLDGALWLTIIFKPLLTPKRAIAIQLESYFGMFVTEQVSMTWNVIQDHTTTVAHDLWPAFGLGVTADYTRIPFYNKALLLKVLDRIRTDRNVKLAVDATFNTNRERLVIIAIGAVYTVPSKRRPRSGCSNVVQSTAIPLMFLLCNTEDEASHTAALQALLNVAAKEGSIDLREFITDVYTDGMGGEHNAYRKVLPHCHLHQCLAHIRRNIRSKVHMCHGSPKILTWLDSVVRFTSQLPRYLDFHAVWVWVLQHLRSRGESRLAGYIESHVLKKFCGHFHCKWRSGLDAVPLGFDCYVSNTIERFWLVGGLWKLYIRLVCFLLWGHFLDYYDIPWCRGGGGVNELGPHRLYLF